MSALGQPEVETPLEDFLHGARPRIRALFGHYRIPEQDTEDILQQALLALVYQYGRVRDPEAWLLGTLRNKCLLYWRQKRRKLYEAVDTAILESMAPAAAPAQEKNDLRSDLDSAMASLPQRCRTLLALRFCQGYDSPELAERLGYSPSSISKITTRCLDALTRYLVLAVPSGKKGRHD
jgi:RNA polymerase sigma factor (sigma-70 family)